MTETLSERIARQKAQRLALRNIPTTPDDWKPLRKAERLIRNAGAEDFPTNIDLNGEEIFE